MTPLKVIVQPNRPNNYWQHTFLQTMDMLKRVQLSVYVAYGVVRFKHKQHLVRIRKRSCFVFA